MGIPGEGIEKNWRNNINDVSRFLNGKHGDTYRIFNLTGEGYDYKKFAGKVIDFYDFPDHHPPCMKRYLAVIKAIDEWITGGPENVAVVHCLAGRSRTGCVVAGYMMYSSMMGTNSSPPVLTTAREAIDFFNFARSEEGQNIVLPSQVRWVNYLEQLLKSRDYETINNPPKYLLKTIRINPPPLVEGEKKKKSALTPITCVKFLAESAKDGRAPITEAVHPQLWADDPITDMRVQAEVAGDIEIILYHNSKTMPDFTKTVAALYSKVQAIQLTSKYPKVPLFRYIFNTAFLQSDQVILTADDLDAPLAGPVATNEYISSSIQVILVFEKLSNTSGSSVPILESSQISNKVTLVPTSIFKTNSGKANIPPSSTTTSTVPQTLNMSAAAPNQTSPILAALEAVASLSPGNSSLPANVVASVSSNTSSPDPNIKSSSSQRTSVATPPVDPAKAPQLPGRSLSSQTNTQPRGPPAGLANVFSTSPQPPHGSQYTTAAAPYPYPYPQQPYPYPHPQPSTYYPTTAHPGPYQSSPSPSAPFLVPSTSRSGLIHSAPPSASSNPTAAPRALPSLVLPHTNPNVGSHRVHAPQAPSGQADGPGLSVLAAVHGGARKSPQVSPRSRSSSSGSGLPKPSEPVLGTPIIDPINNPFASGHSLTPTAVPQRRISDPSATQPKFPPRKISDTPKVVSSTSPLPSPRSTVTPTPVPRVSPAAPPAGSPNPYPSPLRNMDPAASQYQYQYPQADPAAIAYYQQYGYYPPPAQGSQYQYPNQYYPQPQQPASYYYPYQ